MCTYNMNGMTHAIKFKINASMRIYNLENELIMHLVSYK